MRLTVAAFGHIHHKGRVALLTLILLGVLMAAFGLSTIAAAQLHSAIRCQRSARRSIRDDQFAGSIDRAG